MSNAAVVAANGPTPVAADAVANDQAAPARPNWFSMMKGFAVRMLIIYFISSLFRRGQTPVNQSGSGSQPSVDAPSTNIFTKLEPLELYVYLSESERFTDFRNTSLLFWHLTGLRYGDWTGGDANDGTYQKSSKLITPPSLLNNGSLYMHAYFVLPGKSPDPLDKEKGLYDRKYTIYRRKMISKYKRRRVSNTVNLLTGQTEKPIDVEGKANGTSRLPPSTHWHPNMTLTLLDDHTPWQRGAVPPPLDEYVQFYPATNQYYPVVYYNDYWNLNEDYMPVNETTPELTFTLTFTPISLFRWQLYAAQSMRNRWYSGILGENVFEESDADQDTLKKTLIETNPYLLGMTVVVSLIHSVFEFLAFKNDIQFWRSRKSLEGLSVRSVFFNVFQSAVVLLYVLDNETNFVVKCSVFVGLLIEIWKIKKVIIIKVDWAQRWPGGIPRIIFAHHSTYNESPTREFDRLAFRYLSWLLYPLLAIYCVYSLTYQEHRGWYSWVLSMLYGFLLTFGFIMMTPQLFINYKMKSVAHLPWRMLTYKALNTFIDDIFAFVIKMPTLYRIGCLRDDVIFFIFLYQKYIYPVDRSRVNEFGVSGDMLDEHENRNATAEVTGAIEDNSGIVGAASLSTDDTENRNGVEKLESKKTK